MHSSYFPVATPGLSVLSPTQIDEIIQTAYLILERTGAIIRHPEMLQALKKAGADVEGERVYAGRVLVNKALAAAPKGLVIYNQKGQLAMQVHGRRSYYGTSTASPKTRDALSGEIHETRLADIENGAIVANALANIDFVMPFGSAQDCPTKLGDAWEVLRTMQYTDKPIIFCPYSARGTETVIQMAQKVAGGEDALRRKPFMIVYPEPIAPLTWPAEVVDYMIISAKYCFPQLVTGAQLMSMTAPVTVAGAVAQSVAESMMSALMVYSIRPGSPIFMAAIPVATNPRNGLVSMTGPEFQTTLAIQAEVARALGLPTWGCAGASDSHILDAQAGAESALSILFQGLAGVNLIHDVGYLGTGMQCSAAMMVFGNEVISHTKQMLRGLRVDDETLAAEIINKVGPGGNFLANKHTVTHLRSEFWTADLFCKTAYDQWSGEGALSALERCDARVKDILSAERKTVLEPQMTAELEEFINAKG